MTDFLEIKGGTARLLDVSAMPYQTRAGLKAIKLRVQRARDDDGKSPMEILQVDVTLHDQHAVLVSLGKELGMFREGQEPPEFDRTEVEKVGALYQAMSPEERRSFAESMAARMGL